MVQVIVPHPDGFHQSSINVTMELTKSVDNATLLNSADHVDKTSSKLTARLLNVGTWAMRVQLVSSKAYLHSEQEPLRPESTTSYCSNKNAHVDF